MSATGDYKLPFGNIPRLLMAWISTEATKTQNRVLILGDSLSDFMRALGIYNSHGRTQTRLRNQMDRLFHASVELNYEDKHGKQFIASRVVDRGEFWWDPKRPDERSLWNSKIRLGEDFFNEIIRHPVPLDMNTLTALKRSSLGLDLHLWLVYRTFPLRAPQRITWRQIYRQFGVDPAKASDHRTVQDFRKDCLRELKKIKLAWPGAELHHSSGGPDPASLAPCHPSGTRTPAPRGIAPRFLPRRRAR